MNIMTLWVLRRSERFNTYVNHFFFYPTPMQWCHSSTLNMLLSTTVKICIQFKQKHSKVINYEKVKQSFFGFIVSVQMIVIINYASLRFCSVQYRDK